MRFLTGGLPVSPFIGLAPSKSVREQPKSEGSYSAFSNKFQSGREIDACPIVQQIADYKRGVEDAKVTNRVLLGCREAEGVYLYC